MTTTSPATAGMNSIRAALVDAADGKRDPGQVQRVLEPWLGQRIGNTVRIAAVRVPTGAGIANETILLDLEGSSPRCRGLVVRVEPRGIQVYPDADIGDLFRLLATLHASGLVKVPEPLWLEDDKSLLGGRFLVMEQVPGRAPVSQPVYNASGWLKDATPEQRRLVWTTAVEGLASVHRAPAELVGFIGAPRFGETGEDQQLGYWRHYAAWCGFAVPQSVRELGEAVERQRPHEPGMHLSWGDARIGNMLFGDDFRLAAVLDWDQVSLAPPRHDLAWWLYMEHHYSAGEGLARLDGMGSRAETIALWEERTGLVAGDLRWHEAFAAYKLALVTLKILHDAGAPLSAANAMLARFVPAARAAVGLAKV